jgi:hypothetical protein
MTALELIDVSRVLWVYVLLLASALSIQLDFFRFINRHATSLLFQVGVNSIGKPHACKF